MKSLNNKCIAFISLCACFILPVSNSYGCDLAIKAKGSKANGIYSHFKVFINDLDCGGEYTSSTFEEYFFSVPFVSSEIREIKIVFDNDHYSIGEDRNLCIHSIRINDDIPIRASQESVQYRCMNGEEHPYCGMMLWNGSLLFDISKLRFHPGNVTLSSQKEVDRFTSQYVEGNLLISGTDITDLSSLSTLAGVKGALIIKNNINLEKIFGLNSILSVGYLNIENNPKLVAIEGFETLEICGGIQIQDNNNLKTITFFQSRQI